MSTSNKKSRRKSLIAVVLAAALLITGAYAFLTATTETKVNNFTVGNIKIDLDEGPWDELPDTDMDGIPDVAEEIVSGQIIEKAPSIKNIGANDAYGFLLVSVPKAQSAVIAAADGTVARDDNMQPIPSANVELFELLNAEGENILASGTDLGNWKMIDITDALNARENAANDSYNHYLFAYNGVISGSANAGEGTVSATTELFKTVRFANVTEEFAGATAPVLNVNVQAIAIQADKEITSVDTAWTALSNDASFEYPAVVAY